MKKIHPKINNIHIPVLLDEVLEYLNPQLGDSYLDLTAGYGGHAEKIIERTKSSKVTLVDRDSNAITYLEDRFRDSDYEILHSDFLGASINLYKANRKYDLILADLGVSSPHLNEASRGFSFLSDSKLDMRMDQTQELTADYVANKYTQQKLAKIIREYGQEPKAQKIARLIVDNRPIKSTVQLAQIIKKAWPGYSKIHPATRTFQAIRILVNDELGQLETSLPMWGNMLNPKGRLAIISFHSLEDRVVKQYFKKNTSTNYDSTLDLLTKNPVTAKSTELVINPRARSAKLRAVANKNIKERRG
ncbi:MAG TPA: 16S rRNA (cytosine(1402)-N(4))-methyltransferase RsmH [Candidatus Saccharimonadales bacterium]